MLLLGQQGINTRTGPWEGTGVLPSLHGHIKPCLLLSTEQMSNNSRMSVQRAAAVLTKAIAHSSAYLALLGQSRQGAFRWLCFINLAWGPFPHQTSKRHLNLPLLEIMILPLIPSFNKT